MKTLPCLTQARYSRTQSGARRYYGRLQAHFHIDRQLPAHIAATDPAGRDHSGEEEVPRRH